MSFPKCITLTAKVCMTPFKDKIRTSEIRLITTAVDKILWKPTLSGKIKLIKWLVPRRSYDVIIYGWSRQGESSFPLLSSDACCMLRGSPALPSSVGPKIPHSFFVHQVDVVELFIVCPLVITLMYRPWKDGLIKKRRSNSSPSLYGS